MRLAPTSCDPNSSRIVVLPPPRMLWSPDTTAIWATTDPAGAVAPPTVRNENSTFSPSSLGWSTNSKRTSPVPAAYMSLPSKYSLKSKSVIANPRCCCRPHVKRVRTLVAEQRGDSGISERATATGSRRHEFISTYDASSCSRSWSPSPEQQVCHSAGAGHRLDVEPIEKLIVGDPQPFASLELDRR